MRNTTCFILIFLFSFPFGSYAVEEGKEVEVQWNDWYEDREPNWSNYIVDAFLKFGVWQPTGKLAGHFDTSLFGGVQFGFSKNDKDFFDMTFTVVAPAKRRPFDIYPNADEDYAVSVNGTMIVDMLLQYRYRQQISNTVYWNRYIGGGFSMMVLNSTVESGDDGAYMLFCPAVNAGVNVHYKWIGVFAEFNYAFYDISSKLKSKLGGGAINAGVSFSFYY